MNCWVLLRVLVTEVSKDIFHSCIAQHLDDFTDAQFIKVDLSFSASSCEERLKQFFKKWICDGDHVPQVFCDESSGTRHPCCEKTIGNCLRIHICEIIFVQIVN